MVQNYRLLAHGAEQIVQVAANGERFLTGKAFEDIKIIKKGAMVVGMDGKIVAVGEDQKIRDEYKDCTFEQELDLSGKSVVPGLVDAHTHPVWSGDRVREFAAKLRGATYMDIHKMGGGIGYTVKCTHESSEDELYDLLVERLDRMLKLGTTLVEAKSGYGLDLPNEKKMLKVLHRAQKDHRIDIVSTYLGAHSIPKGKTAEEATKDVIEVQIPALVKARDAGEISPEFIDVFHEKGVFEYEDSQKILKAGQDNGFKINFHGDELNPSKSAELAASLGARAVTHCEEISEQGIKDIAKSKTAAVILPTTAHILRLEYPPVKKMIEAGAVVALGSDFNPNAFCMSMPFVMHLACVSMRISMNQALAASTINSAYSINREKTHGSLEVGKAGDFVVVDHANWEHLIYELADHPIAAVYKGGNRVTRHSLSA